MDNEKKRALTKTFGVTYYGEDEKESKALSVDYLESNIRIAIHRPSNGGDTKYDYKSGNEIYLREKSAKSLSRLIEKAIHKRDKGEDIPTLSISSGASLIEVSAGKRHNCNTDICITIYNEIDPDSKKCQNYSVFGFRNSNVISNYDPDTGSYESIPIDSDIVYFMMQLNEFSKSATNAYSHNAKKENKFDMDRIIARQLDICEKLGIKHENIYSSKNSWNQNNTGNSGSAVSLSDASDILNELDDLG